MNAITAAIPSDVVPPEVVSLEIIEVAVRLADEGIPIRAIARATDLPSADVYEALRGAIANGSLIEMPRDDWPATSTRATRSLLNGTPLESMEALKRACSRFFKASPLEAAILASILKHTEVTKEHLHGVIQHRPGEADKEVEPKMVDVMVCKLRKKLKAHGIFVETIWGFGYLINAEHRAATIALLLKFVKEN